MGLCEFKNPGIFTMTTTIWCHIAAGASVQGVDRAFPFVSVELRCSLYTFLGDWASISIISIFKYFKSKSCEGVLPKADGSSQKQMGHWPRIYCHLLYLLQTRKSKLLCHLVPQQSSPSEESMTIILRRRRPKLLKELILISTQYRCNHILLHGKTHPEHPTLTETTIEKGIQGKRWSSQLPSKKRGRPLHFKRQTWSLGSSECDSFA